MPVVVRVLVNPWRPLFCPFTRDDPCLGVSPSTRRPLSTLCRPDPLRGSPPRWSGSTTPLALSSRSGRTWSAHRHGPGLPGPPLHVPPLLASCRAQHQSTDHSARRDTRGTKPNTPSGTVPDTPADTPPVSSTGNIPSDTPSECSTGHTVGHTAGSSTGRTTGHTAGSGTGHTVRPQDTPPGSTGHTTGYECYVLFGDRCTSATHCSRWTTELRRYTTCVRHPLSWSPRPPDPWVTSGGSVSTTGSGVLTSVPPRVFLLGSSNPSEHTHLPTVPRSPPQSPVPVPSGESFPSDSTSSLSPDETTDVPHPTRPVSYSPDDRRSRPTHRGLLRPLSSRPTCTTNTGTLRSTGGFLPTLVSSPFGWGPCRRRLQRASRVPVLLCPGHPCHR